MVSLRHLRKENTMGKNKTKRVALYCRVSTGHQSTDAQRAELTALAERRGWSIHKVYEDKGESGKKESRPAFDEMMADSAKGKIDIVVVWRCDRFSRSVRHFVNTLHSLEQMGVGFFSANEGIDLTSENPLTCCLSIHLVLQLTVRRHIAWSIDKTFPLPV
jgi:DNA invertase Pin-like site-specific DNA recombinase